MAGPARLPVGESIDLYLDGSDFTVRVVHLAHDGHAVELQGVGCRLTGEMPGLYYPEAEQAPSAA